MGSVAAHDAADLMARGVEVAVFVPRIGVRPAPPGATALRSWWSIGNAAVMPQLFWRLRGFDVVHLHYPFYGTDIFVALACLIWNIPLVMTYHMVAHAPDYRQRLFSLHRKICEPIVLRIARRVLVSSLDYAKAVGLRHRRLIERPLSVDTQRFAPGDRQAARQKLGVLPREKVILFVGGLDHAHFFKGLGALLIAVQDLPGSLPWRLLIVGDGELRKRYQKMASDIEITGRVTFLGNVDDETLPYVFQAADLHILPSMEMNEAFGLVTLEAAASGIPSVVSDLPGVRTVVVPHQTGLLVPPKDAGAITHVLDKLLSDDELRERMGAAARQRVLEKYDEKLLADDLIPLYNGMKRAALL